MGLDQNLNEYFSECEEVIQRFTTSLGKLEKLKKSNIPAGALSEASGAQQDPVHTLVDDMYRDIHTLKGTSQLFGFTRVGEVAHAIEAAYEPLRRLKLDITPKFADIIYKAVDLIERILKSSALTQKEQSEPFLKELETVISHLIEEATRLFNAEFALEKETVVSFEIPEKGSKNPGIPKVEEVIVHKNSENLSTEVKMASVGLTDEKHLGSLEAKSSPAAAPLANDPDAATTSVRIQVSILDKLMNLVGEMVLVRNQVLQYSMTHEDIEFANLSQRLDLVTSELQEEVMKTRMQPIGNILSKFQRVVRDLGKDLKKQIELTLIGSETELDKTLIETIKDPLTHIIRNACDHGIELPNERVNSGKNPTGKLKINAYHEGGQVVIEVSDDGRGLNYPRILSKALEKQIISAEEAKKLTESEIGNLIFAPGFSTSEQVSAVSGRGVGMDVVKTNLEKAGGQVELQSQFGKGMTIRLKIPLTLAIVPALIVKVASDVFAIPQVKLAELVRVDNEGDGPKIEWLQGKPILRLRGKLLSLISADALLKFPNPINRESLTSGSTNIVVLNDEKENFGLIVDEVRDTADIVVKPLPPFLKRLSAYSGATITGDGAVCLILDIAGLSKVANFTKKNSPEKAGKFSIGEDLNKGTKQNLEMQDFILFQLNDAELFSIPLCLVHRLEEFKLKDVEVSGAKKFVKYRGQLLPILALDEQLKKASQPQQQIQDVISVIVVQKFGKFFGIQVGEIVDIISSNSVIEEQLLNQQGLLGNMIFGEKVVTVVDVLGILDSIWGAVYAPKKNNLSGELASIPNSFEVSLSGVKVLLAEDTPFFVKQIRKVLESQGIVVTHAPDGEKAWEILNSVPENTFQLVLSDIEMPHLNGFELATKIRQESKFGKLPLVAITTRFRDVDREKGKEVGFNRYLEKLKSEQLIEAISGLLQTNPSKRGATING